MDRPLKRGDIIPVTDEHNAFNKRNGLPRYRVQEVLAVLKPGERACDHGIHGRCYGYLNAGEERIVVNNQVASGLNRDTIFLPLRHDAPEPPPPKFARVRYTKTTIVPNTGDNRG
jgi:hypothetical protein